MNGTQVPAAHYDWIDYNHRPRWTSFWHQITEVAGTGAQSCLEIGTGIGAVRDALVRLGVSVTSVDIAEDLGPDLIGDVRALPCADESFDAVLASQVLEHIPWDDVPQAVSELRRVCRSHSVVSLPQSGLGLGVVINVSLCGVGERGFHVRLPTPRRYRFDGQHYWQVGARGSSRQAARKVLSQGFTIEREFTPHGMTYHRFYVLKKL